MCRWKCSAKELDGSLDPIHPSKIGGKASCGALFFFEHFIDPSDKIKLDRLPPFVKIPGGQLPEDYKKCFTHLMSRDAYVFGVEHMFATKQEFWGVGYINWCISEFGDIAAKIGVFNQLPHESIHVGEIVTYISYGYMYGDMQTIVCAIHQLIRRKSKVISNLRVKESHNDGGKKSIVNLTVDGWTANYNLNYVNPKEEGNVYNGKKKDYNKGEKGARTPFKPNGDQKNPHKQQPGTPYRPRRSVEGNH